MDKKEVDDDVFKMNLLYKTTKTVPFLVTLNEHYLILTAISAFFVMVMIFFPVQYLKTWATNGKCSIKCCLLPFTT